jgi:hypothetical protein
MRRNSVSFGPVIAERRLHPRGAPRRSVVVALGRPRKRNGSDEWECPFRIAGAGIRHVEYGRGIDAFQALTMALEGVRYFLDRSETPLVWDGVSEDDSGFQRVIPLLPERGGTTRLERMVDRELLARMRKLERRHRAAQRRRTRA